MSPVRHTWLAPVLLVAVLATELAPAQGLTPPFYSAKPIRATVVDEATGRPLEGVVVVAQWVLRRPYGDGPRLQVTEAVTDAEGRFFIPGWGPKPRPPLMELQGKSPLLTLFKHGYVPLELRSAPKKRMAELRPNYREMSTRRLREVMSPFGDPTEAVQESVWDGLTIQLEPFRGTPERWLDLLYHLASSIDDEDAPQALRFFEAIRAERTYFDANPVPRSKRVSLIGLFSRIDDLLK